MTGIILYVSFRTSQLHLILQALTLWKILFNDDETALLLIELLVVVLILAILMAVSLPLYLSAVGDSKKKTYRANMQTISTARSGSNQTERA